MIHTLLIHAATTITIFTHSLAATRVRRVRKCCVSFCSIIYSNDHKIMIILYQHTYLLRGYIALFSYNSLVFAAKRIPSWFMSSDNSFRWFIKIGPILLHNLQPPYDIYLHSWLVVTIKYLFEWLH